MKFLIFTPTQQKTAKEQFIEVETDVWTKIRAESARGTVRYADPDQFVHPVTGEHAIPITPEVEKHLKLDQQTNLTTFDRLVRDGWFPKRPDDPLSTLPKVVDFQNAAFTALDTETPAEVAGAGNILYRHKWKIVSAVVGAAAAASALYFFG